MLTVLAVQEKLGETEAEMAAIQQTAADEKRDLTKDEVAQVNALLAVFEETQAVLETAKKYEAAKEAILRDRANAGMQQASQVQQQVHHQTTQQQQVHQPAVMAGYETQTTQANRINVVGTVRKSQLKVFKDPKEAYAAGMWFKAAILKDHAAMQFCREHGNFVDGGLGFAETQMGSGPAMMVQSNGGGAYMAQTTDIAAQGGVFVPVIISQRLLDARDRVGAAAMCADIYPMSGSDDENYPKDDSALTVYGKSELGDITTSGLTFSDVQLRARDRYTLTPISNTLLRNKPDFAGDLIASRIVHAFRLQQDEDWINGDGLNQAPNYGIDGLINTLGAAGVVTATGASSWDDITAANIRSLKQILADKFFTENTKWLCSRSFFNVVFEPLIEARGGSKADMEGATGLSYQGFPVVTTDRMATTFALSSTPLIFGDFQASCVLGDREQIAIASSEHIYFHQDAVAVRGAIAYDINNHRGGDGSTAGGYVGLRMPAT